MTSSKEYVSYVLDRLSEAAEASSRAMMGEYVLYYRDRVVGGIYDDRLLVKPIEAAPSLSSFRLPVNAPHCLRTEIVPQRVWKAT